MTVFVFAKAPVAGGVKSRLARTMGDVRATAWYRRALGRTQNAALQSRLSCVVAAAPSAHAFRMTSPSGAHVIGQSAGNLGRRMVVAARQARNASLIVGCDIPDLTPAILRDAARALCRFDLVLGPARDGGFYLVGLKTPAHAFRLYDGVRWSSEHAMSDTLANAPKHWRVFFLPALSDVDEARDLADRRS